MKGKNNLFKILGIVLVVVIALTWIFPGASFDGKAIVINETTAPAGLWGIFSYIWEYSFFIVAGLFFLVVGGFYGILNKTNVYQPLVNKTAKLFKGKEFWFVVLSTIFFSLVAACTGTKLGVPLSLFVIVPFFVSVILALNYNKFVAMASTFGAILAGMVGGLYGEANSTAFMKAVNITKFGDSMVYRLMALVLSVAVLLGFIKYYLKNNTNKKNAEKAEDLLLVKEAKTKKPMWPMLVVLVLVSFVSVVGMASTWEVINFTAFADMHKAITDVKINDFAIFANLLGTVGELGTWTLIDVVISLLLASVVLVFAYKIDWTEAYAAFAESAKKLLPLTLLVWLVSTILLIVFQHPFYMNFTKSILEMSKDFNVVVVAVIAMMNTTLLTEGIYFAGFTLPAITAVYNDAAGMIALSAQLFSGLTLFVAPTSLILLAGLYYLNITFQEWLKFIWKYLLMLLAVITVVLLVAYKFPELTMSPEVVGLVLYIAVMLVIGLLSLVSMWKIYQKAGKKGWEAIIPIYSTVVYLQIIGMNPWMTLLMFIPGVNLILAVVMSIKLAKCFGKTEGFAIGLLILPMIFAPILAFSDLKFKKV